MKQYTLPIATNYVSHWGIWEAVREILQNAYDERDKAITNGIDCDVDMKYEDNTLTITQTRGKLTPSTLLLGNTSKAEDKAARGKFGEGYKLALLVLARNGKDVTIHNNDSVWKPVIEFDDTYQADVLKINTDEGNGMITGIIFTITGITGEEYSLIKDNIYKYTIDVVDMPNMIIKDAGHEGRIYVGGLYVTTLKNYRYGYHFSPKTMKVDRDRGMVHDFDVAFATSRLWTDEKFATTSGYDETYKLVKEEAPDVKYVEYQVSGSYTQGISGSYYSGGYTSPAAASIKDKFQEEHGDAIPVSTQHEIEKATKAGVKWALVPQTLKNILGKVMSIFIPAAVSSPADRLEKFKKVYGDYLPPHAIEELDDIIGMISTEATV